MQGGKIQYQELRIQGRNFCGSVQVSEHKLALNVTQFKKGAVFSLHISNDTLVSQPRKFLIFKKTDDLLDELLGNEGMEISDENNLRIPIKVIYRGKLFELTLEVPLQPSNLSQAEKNKKLLEELEKLSMKLQQHETYTLSYRLPKFKFQADLTNQNFNKFRVDGRKVQMLGSNQHTTFNHNQTLPKSGIYYFQFRVIKTISNYIFFGVCGASIKSAVNSYTHQLFMGYYLHNGQLYAKGTNIVAVSSPQIVVGLSVIKVEIDMDKKQLSWLTDNKLLHTAQFGKELEGVKLYPFANLYSLGDIVQILSM